MSILGIHAREWISPATATFIMKQLVERNYENQDLTDFYDFYILPVANPDGWVCFLIRVLWSWCVYVNKAWDYCKISKSETGKIRNN